MEEDKHYITVVEVDDPNDKKVIQQKVILPNENDDLDEDSSFITVLSINENESKLNQKKKLPTVLSETVVVYRLPGERLGFGLKFQGGTKSNEKIQRLFIQSCAPDSPASRVKASWGHLKEGDEILTIDEQPVIQMTRIECVKCLKESNVAIKLELRNGDGIKNEYSEEDKAKLNQQPPPPPPVPPRKLLKRKPSDKVTTIKDEKCNTPPPDPDYYINLLSDETASVITGSESDDTSSSISTVIDKFSLSSSYSSESDLTNYGLLNGTSNMINKSDLAKVLQPFTLLEEEFNVDSSAQLEECLKKLEPIDINQKIILATEVHIEQNNNIRPYENIEINLNSNRTMDNSSKNQYENVELNKKDSKFVNPYENINLKSVKIEEKNSNDYENIELSCGINSKVAEYENVELPVPPTPKPRILEPKRRQILPVPRKINLPTKLETNQVSKIDVNLVNLTESTSKNISSSNSQSSKSSDLITKIPKAITSIFSSSSSQNSKNVERAKTDIDLKIRAKSTSPLGAEMSSIQRQCELFIKIEMQSSQEKLHSRCLKSCDDIEKLGKSKIPVILPPRKLSFEDTININLIESKPVLIKTSLTKQKSESDLKLALQRTKSNENNKISNLPTFKPMSNQTNSNDKQILQRSLSADAKQSPERTTQIPKLSQETIAKLRGPKPKPPERVQSLQKTTGIPKLLNSPIEEFRTFKPNNVKPQSNNIDINQNKQGTHNKDIKFKIQTYEGSSLEQDVLQLNNLNRPQSSTMTSTFNNKPVINKIIATSADDLKSKENTFNGSLDSLTLQNGKDIPNRNIEITEIKQTKIDIFKNLENLDDSEILDEIEQPDLNIPIVVVGKCKKIDAANSENYLVSSSSSEDDEDEEKNYDIEEGEKLGPPELINGPGPSEAYFNSFPWHSNMLPTIGEVEEEFSSLELQQQLGKQKELQLQQQQQNQIQSSGMPFVLINDLPEQKIGLDQQKQENSIKTLSKVLDTTKENDNNKHKVENIINISSLNLENVEQQSNKKPHAPPPPPPVQSTTKVLINPTIASVEKQIQQSEKLIINSGVEIKTNDNKNSNETITSNLEFKDNKIEILTNSNNLSDMLNSETKLSRNFETENISLVEIECVEQIINTDKLSEEIHENELRKNEKENEINPNKITEQPKLQFHRQREQEKQPNINEKKNKTVNDVPVNKTILEILSTTITTETPTTITSTTISTSSPSSSSLSSECMISDIKSSNVVTVTDSNKDKITSMENPQPTTSDVIIAKSSNITSVHIEKPKTPDKCELNGRPEKRGILVSIIKKSLFGRGSNTEKMDKDSKKNSKNIKKVESSEAIGPKNEENDNNLLETNGQNDGEQSFNNKKIDNKDMVSEKVTEKDVMENKIRVKDSLTPVKGKAPDIPKEISKDTKTKPISLENESEKSQINIEMENVKNIMKSNTKSTNKESKTKSIDEQNKIVEAKLSEVIKSAPSTPSLFEEIKISIVENVTSEDETIVDAKLVPVKVQSKNVVPEDKTKPVLKSFTTDVEQLQNNDTSNKDYLKQKKFSNLKEICLEFLTKETQHSGDLNSLKHIVKNNSKEVSTIKSAIQEKPHKKKTPPPPPIRTSKSLSDRSLSSSQNSITSSNGSEEISKVSDDNIFKCQEESKKSEIITSEDKENESTLSKSVSLELLNKTTDEKPTNGRRFSDDKYIDKIIERDLFYWKLFNKNRSEPTGKEDDKKTKQIEQIKQAKVEPIEIERKEITIKSETVLSASMHNETLEKPSLDQRIILGDEDNSKITHKIDSTKVTVSSKNDSIKSSSESNDSSDSRINIETDHHKIIHKIENNNNVSLRVKESNPKLLLDDDRFTEIPPEAIWNVKREENNNNENCPDAAVIKTHVPVSESQVLNQQNKKGQASYYSQ